jgi:hypothetical protein
LTGKGNFNLFAGAPGVIFLGIFIAGSFPEVEGKYSFFPFLSPLGLRKTAGEMEWFGSSFHNFRLARGHPRYFASMAIGNHSPVHPPGTRKNDRRYPGKLKEREGMSK